VTADCTHCKATGTVPGPLHKEYGEIIDCPICKGHKVTPEVIPLAQFRALMALRPVSREHHPS
jgi:hypothetical protein